MNSRVRALSVTHVLPNQATGLQPPGHAIKLSLFDTQFMAAIPIQRLFFYQRSDLPPSPSISLSLQSSLAATLAVFTPLAGKLTASSSGEAFIDCSPGTVCPGVRFVEAEFAGDMRRLARDGEHDVEAFLQLVPDLPVGKLPAPILAVQVTRPADSGANIVAVGVSVHHAVIDGQALWQFFRAWAAVSRGESSPAGPGRAPPSFDRGAVISRHPKADELARKFVRVFAPVLPTVNVFPGPDITRQRRRTYVLSADHIRSLKHRISQQQSRGAKNDPAVVLEPPTTYTAIASLVWTSIVRAKTSSTHAADDVVHLMFAADCRSRLRPPLDDGGAFFGNCVRSCYGSATAGELCGYGRLARAAAAVRDAVHAYLDDPLADAERWLELSGAFPLENVTFIGSSHRFAAYETDFGWGAPSRVELVSVFCRQFVALLGARDGAVQVSVALDRERMDDFEANFLSQLQGSSAGH